MQKDTQLKTLDPIHGITKYLQKKNQALSSAKIKFKFNQK